MNILFLLSISLTSCAQQNMKYNELNPDEKRVIINKGTELPFTGKYYQYNEEGIYTCKQCDLPLFYSNFKFESHCGWPSFDDEISGAVLHLPDADGRRTEIVCAYCQGHLGHVFEGEGFTQKNIRHCVNSISMNFVKTGEPLKKDRAVFASGCFWGTQYFLNKAKGVLSTRVGYIGGHVKNPSYKQVCTGTTGHAEAVEVIFDPQQTNYETLAKLFFETHDFTQIDRQGPDIGEQYRSEIFYVHPQQQKIADSLIQILTKKGYEVATEVTKATLFYPAEDYHQHYYEKKNGTPYCHRKIEIF